MGKLIISLAALAALSSASLAAQGSPGDGVDSDNPRVFENSKPSNKATINNLDINNDALATGEVSKSSFDPFRLQGSQIR
jgi:hypothetical protein